MQGKVRWRELFQIGEVILFKYCRNNIIGKFLINNSSIGQLMNNCISKFARAPIEYINDIRALKTDSITMKGTTFYPAFPLALLSSILCLCGLSTYMIYYFFTVDQSTCYAHITYGIIALAIIYPIQSIIIYICMFGSVALSQTHCWKVFSIVFFGLIVTGFSFGGLGFAFLCTISKEHQLLIPSSFLSSNTFIQIIVYGYLSFFGLYLILMPLLTFSYNQRSKDANLESSCYDTFCCVVYYICQFLFMVTALFMICIKIMGPPLLIYVLIEVARTGFRNSITDLSVFFTLSILSIFLPLFSFTVAYLIANLACKPKQATSEVQNNEEKAEEKPMQQIDSKQKVSKRKSVFLAGDDSRTFGEDMQSSGINNDML